MYAEMTPATDRTSAAELASEFHSYMHHVARRMLWKASPIARLMDAEDLGQEIATTILRRQARWDPSVCKFTTWIWQIARHTLNNCYDYARASMRSATTWRAQSYDELAHSPPSDGRIRSGAFWCFVADHVTERQLQALEMHFRQGLGVREIASKLGTSKSSAHKHLIAGLDQLRPFGEFLQELARAN